MSAKKACVACGKQIPTTAVVCVFCSAKQPVSDPELADGEVAQASASEAAASVVSAHQTDPTLIGIRASDVQAALDDKAEKGDAPENGTNGTPASVRPTAAIPIVSAEAPQAAEATTALEARSEPAPSEAVDRRPSTADAHPWESLGRLIMGIGGGVLVALFFCPWHGVSSWQLLETLTGADFVRQLFYLTGGIVLLAAALLPLPFVFRATVGTLVAATPVLLGAGGLLDGWRGVVAALAVVGLPATHLLRSRAQSSAAARLLVVAAVLAVVLLYLLPSSSVVPIAAVFKMMGSGAVGAVLGLFVLIPLVFAAMSLFGALGRDLADIGVLLSVLILLWAPVGVALRGLIIEDATQLYVAVGLLWASATAALSLAQLLSIAARPRAS